MLAIGLAASAFPSHAATFTVINTNDSGAGSLRQALSDAESGAGADIVNITATGTITLTSGQINVSDNAGVTITGPGATNLTITTALNSRVFNFANAGTVRISGISFSSAGGAATCAGGALAFDRTNAAISQSVFTTNGSSTGGSCGGGAVLFGSGANPSNTLSIDDSNFDRNRGAAVDAEGVLTISRSVFIGNANGGTDQGGAVRLGAGSLTIRDSIFTGNVAGSGGAILAQGSSITISGSTFSSNSVTDTGGVGGGAASLVASGAIVIENSTFTSNIAAGNKSSALSLGGTTTLRNLTIVGNGAVGTTGTAVDLFGNNPVTLLNTVVSNQASGVDLSGSLGTFSGTNSLVTDPGTVVLGGSGNLSGTPTIGALANNGSLVVGAAGFTSALPTMLPPLGSQLINAGSNAAVGSLSSDQRGAGFARIIGASVDIGAVETADVVLVEPPTTTAVPTLDVFALLLSTLLTALVGALRLKKRQQ
ncbi:MAG: hypothetical protein EAZ30_04890 [Betaproteobacteria bacterium]|nr:MAG: hypothetical protein EAZ30_04890 [Betaproteobacteria bacterium]